MATIDLPRGTTVPGLRLRPYAGEADIPEIVRIKNAAGTVLYSVSGSPITNGAGSAFGRTDGWALVAGNTITVENNGSSVVVDDDGVTIDGVSVTKPARSIWSKREWSEECGAYLYWSAKAKGWYRFNPDDRAYYPVEVYPETE